MSGKHLTVEQIERARRFTLDPQEIPEVYTHLGECGSCRANVAISEGVSARVTNLNARLLLETLSEPEHLTYDEISAYVDVVEVLDQDRIKDHLASCLDCRTKESEIRHLRKELDEAIEPHPTLAPMPRATLVDTSGSVVLEGDEIRLPSMANIHKSLRTLVHGLFINGIAKPTRSLRDLLDLQRDSIVYLPSPIASRGMGTRDTHASHRSPPDSASMRHSILISPKDTVIRSATPVLQWQSIPGAREYRVNVRWQQDPIDVRTLWESHVGERTETALPDTIRLEPDQLYLWSVEAILEDDGRIESHPAWFSVLSPSAQKQLATLERVYADSALILAGLYEQHGLYADAQGQIDRLKPLNAGNSLIETLQQRLNRERSHELTNP